MQANTTLSRSPPRSRLRTSAKRLRPGILPATKIEGLINSGVILAGSPFVPGQIQPASLDLRLGVRAFRVHASFLPGSGRTVEQRLFELHASEIDLTNGV